MGAAITADCNHDRIYPGTASVITTDPGYHPMSLGITTNCRSVIICIMTVCNQPAWIVVGITVDWGRCTPGTAIVAGVGHQNITVIANCSIEGVSGTPGDHPVALAIGCNAGFDVVVIITGKIGLQRRACTPCEPMICGSGKIQIFVDTVARSFVVSLWIH